MAAKSKSKTATAQQLLKAAEEDRKAAHDMAVEAGKKLTDASDKLAKAEQLMLEANMRMSNARKFEKVLIERQRKLDRAFVLLNKQKDGLAQAKVRLDDRELMLEENQQRF